MRLRRFFRSLFREPRTAVPALILLALGVGGFAWMVALQRSLMLRTLPVREPGRLLSLWNGVASEPEVRGTPSTGELQLMRGFPQVFEGVAAWRPLNASLGLEDPSRVRLDRVTGNYFDVLGVRVAMGRAFLPSDDEAGAPPTLLMSHRLWQSRFGADPAILGRHIVVDGASVEVIGILPRGFHTPAGTDIFRPFQWTTAQRDDLGPHFLRVVARLRSTATLSQAREAMKQVAGRVQEIARTEQAPESLVSQIAYGAAPLINELLGHGLSVMRVLLVAAGLVLVLAAYNAGAVLLARGLNRQTEMAVRHALGAQPASLRRLLLAEGAVLGLIGAAAGLLLAQVCLGATGRALSWGFPDLATEDMRLDQVAVAAALILGPALGAGCALAAQPGKRLADLLRMGGRQPALAGRRAHRILVGAQLLLSGAMLTAALYLHHGVSRLMSTDPGFEISGASSFQVHPGSRLPLADRDRLARSIGEKLSALPGVASAGAANGLPMSGFRSDLGITFPDGHRIDPQARAMTPGTVRALGLRLLRGRDIDTGDGAGSARVALVTRQLAKEAFGTEEVIGRTLPFDDKSATIVGVLDDVREFSPAVKAPPIFYLPMAQSEFLWHEDLHFVLRTKGPAPSEAQIRQALREAAPGLALHRYQTLEDSMKSQLGPQRMGRAFIAAFACVALLLAAGGVFSIVAAQVVARRVEFGVRAALGAPPLAIVGQVLRETALLAVPLGAAGVLAGALYNRLGESVLGGPSTFAARQFLWPEILLVGTALLASLIPALRAARTEPAEALRQN